MYRAVLDTCALVPGLMRDFLLQLATEEAYAPLWGSGIRYEYDYDLADPGDGHVAHAAIIGRADAIVTDDTRSGLENAEAIIGANIEIIHPKDFAANTVAAHPDSGVRALTKMGSPPLEPTADPGTDPGRSHRQVRHDRSRRNAPSPAHRERAVVNIDIRSTRGSVGPPF